MLGIIAEITQFNLWSNIFTFFGVLIAAMTLITMWMRGYNKALDLKVDQDKYEIKFKETKKEIDKKLDETTFNAFKESSDEKEQRNYDAILRIDDYIKKINNKK